jgi:NAD-dependent deacetylase
MNDAIEFGGRFAELLKDSDCTVVLTGAGVSTASGIPDFRSTGGLFSRISQETFEIAGFYQDPLRYYRTAVEHIHGLADKSPNVTHRMLARLERLGLIEAVVTQNIDGLHQKAGSRNVLEFHGDVTSFHCTACGRTSDRAAVETSVKAGALPRCQACSGLIRPGITFYGDPIQPGILQASCDLAERAGLFVVMGSSLNVNPAAALAGMAVRAGARLVIVNLAPTPYDSMGEHVWPVDLEAFSEATLQALGASLR